MKLTALIVALIFAPLSMAFGQPTYSVSLDHVSGALNATEIPTGAEISFFIRYTNGNADSSFSGISSGFRVYSTDGAEWTTTTMDTLPTLTWAINFDLVVGFFLVSITGTNADTLGFMGSRLLSVGLPASFDDTAIVITIGPIDAAHDGKTICLDSSWYAPAGVWKWTFSGGLGNDRIPDWDGPHCYNIMAPQDVTLISGDNLPTTFTLGQNYPNPFNPTTNIAFDLPTRSQVTLTVYNVLGQQVATLVNEKLGAGSYEADWDGRSSSGNSVASGIYFYRLHTEQFTQTKKMILLK